MYLRGFQLYYGIMMLLIPITLGILTWAMLRRPREYTWMDELREYHAEPVKPKNARDLLSEMGFDLEGEL